VEEKAGSEDYEFALREVEALSLGNRLIVFLVDGEMFGKSLLLR